MDAMIARAPVDPEKVVEDVEHLSISPYGPARASITEHPLSSGEVSKMTDYFHASLVSSIEAMTKNLLTLCDSTCAWA
jgi:xylulose-5-phosphate/fructose-6-phosphate phosphoketolase